MGIVMLLSKFGKSSFKIALLTAVALIGLRAQGFAQPVQYVRICDAFGQGFFNIPGTDTCIRVSGGVEAGYGGTPTNFHDKPHFEVSCPGALECLNTPALF